MPQIAIPGWGAELGSGPETTPVGGMNWTADAALAPAQPSQAPGSAWQHMPAPTHYFALVQPQPQAEAPQVSVVQAGTAPASGSQQGSSQAEVMESISGTRHEVRLQTYLRPALNWVKRQAGWLAGRQDRQA